MKKARLILSGIAILAVVGGAFAFKAARVGNGAAFTLTRTITVNGVAYSATSSFYAPITAQYLTTTGGPLTSKYRTTGVIAPLTITLTQVGGTATTTLPHWTATLTNTYTTNVD